MVPFITERKSVHGYFVSNTVNLSIATMFYMGHLYITDTCVESKLGLTIVISFKTNLSIADTYLKWTSLESFLRTNGVNY